MALDDLKIIRPHKLCELLDIHISTLYRWMDEGKLPIDKVQIGPRAVGFRESDVEKWLMGELDFDSVDKSASDKVHYNSKNAI